MKRPARSFTDRIADRGVAFMLALFCLAKKRRTVEDQTWIEAYEMTLTQRAMQGARQGES